MSAPTTPPAQFGTLTIHRGQLVAVSVIGVILGLIGLFLPGVSFLTIAILFGIYLIASGIFRINSALLTHGISGGIRWLTGLLGVLVVAAGVIALIHPNQSLVVLAYVIGIGFLAEGIVDVMLGVQGGPRPRWFYWVSGILSIISGLITFFLPALAILTFVQIGSVLLLIVSVSTLLTLPKREPRQ